MGREMDKRKKKTSKSSKSKKTSNRVYFGVKNGTKSAYASVPGPSKKVLDAIWTGVAGTVCVIGLMVTNSFIKRH